MKKLLVNLINFYQTYLSFDNGALALLAPGGACRGEVKCSQYSKQMIIKHGAVTGVILGVKRIWSCR